MPVNLRLFHSGVGDMANLFNKKYEEHKTSQLENPFSEWEGAGLNKRRLSREDASYGRPKEGSLSERRSQAAQQHLLQETKFLLENIWDCAQWKHPDGRAAITFGKVFNLYRGISDKVVGTLLRARRHGYLHFEGEMLYQGRDEDKVIELTKNINTIRARFGQPPLPNGGNVEPWGTIEETPPGSSNTTPGSSRRSSFVHFGRNSSQEESEQKNTEREDDLGAESSVDAEASKGCRKKFLVKKSSTDEPEWEPDCSATANLMQRPQIAVNDQIILEEYNEGGIASKESLSVSRKQEAVPEMSNKNGGEQLVDKNTESQNNKEIGVDEERSQGTTEETNTDTNPIGTEEDTGAKDVPCDNNIIRVEEGRSRVSEDTSDCEDTSGEGDDVSEIKQVSIKSSYKATNRCVTDKGKKEFSESEDNSDNDPQGGSRLGKGTQRRSGKANRNGKTLSKKKKSMKKSIRTGGAKSRDESDNEDDSETESKGKPKTTTTTVGVKSKAQLARKSHIRNINKPVDNSTPSKKFDKADGIKDETKSE
ncbi:uncharacterized protein LOC143034205 [Oratosquilla oratoria]|uniref:uncharacterized protein LOC143034205 n=1 Tax=Oratosquilla oratoria TaxID=337810 RepID=UPI003F75F30C